MLGIGKEKKKNSFQTFKIDKIKLRIDNIEICVYLVHQILVLCIIIV